MNKFLITVCLFLSIFLFPCISQTEDSYVGCWENATEQLKLFHSKLMNLNFAPDPIDHSTSGIMMSSPKIKEMTETPLELRKKIWEEIYTLEAEKKLEKTKQGE